MQPYGPTCLLGLHPETVTMDKMGPALKKKTPPAPAPKKPRLSQTEAMVRMVDATYRLLLQFHPAEVTVARICEKAGVHSDYVVRYFGSRDELLCQAVEAAFSTFFSDNDGKDATRLQVIVEEADAMVMAKARVRTMVYLMGCGMNPERFQEAQKKVIDSILAQSRNPKVADRTALNMVLIGLMLIQGTNTFAEVNSMSQQQIQDVLSYVGYLGQTGETVEAALGWDQPQVKKKK